MPILFSISPSRLMAAAVLAVVAPLSMAHGDPDVSWSVSIGSPRVYAPPPVVYAPPPVVYTSPAPVYVRPQPVYVQPAPAFGYGQSYYVQEVRPRHFRHHNHWRHEHRRD